LAPAFFAARAFIRLSTSVLSAEGMNMGLAISHSTIETHGRRLWATPNEPHGAVFQFSLPVDGETLS
jgi:K+-sensing histidine kinase KdpD